MSKFLKFEDASESVFAFGGWANIAHIKGLYGSMGAFVIHILSLWSHSWDISQKIKIYLRRKKK